MKVYFDAILKTVHDVDDSGKGPKQKIMFSCPQYDRFSGEKLRDDLYESVILGDNIQRLQAKNLEGEIVRATCFLNTYDRVVDDKTYHNLNLSCVELELKKEA